MKKIKGMVSVLMTLVTVFLVFACTQMSASAASTAAFDKLSTSKYAKTYTLSSSGITKPYTSNKLNTRGSVTYGSSSTAYIDNASDELYVFDVGKNSSGKYYAYVSYPISSSKRAKAYIPLSAITSNNGSHKAVKSTGKFYCSTRSNNSTSKSYYVDKGDTVYLIATKDSKYQIMYPNSRGLWRIAWCSKTDYNKYCTSGDQTPSTKTYTGYVNTSSAPLVLRQSASTSAKALANMPKGSQLTVLDNKTKTNGFYHVKYSGITGYASASYITFTKPATFSLVWPAESNYVTCMYYYASGNKHSTRYGYQNAIDIAGGGNVYAAASGTVETAAYQSGGFGNYVVIVHSNGTKTLYGHLKSYSVKKGQTVSQGQVIGVMGSTGNSSGTHLHFEWSGGDPWKTYFKTNSSLKYEINVRSNNLKYNSDKTIVNWIDSNYTYRNGWYYHK